MGWKTIITCEGLKVPGESLTLHFRHTVGGHCLGVVCVFDFVPSVCIAWIDCCMCCARRLASFGAKD